jgi:hypothetical protein
MYYGCRGGSKGKGLTYNLVIPLDSADLKGYLESRSAVYHGYGISTPGYFLNLFFHSSDKTANIGDILSIYALHKVGLFIAKEFRTVKQHRIHIWVQPFDVINYFIVGDHVRLLSEILCQFRWARRQVLENSVEQFVARPDKSPDGQEDQQKVAEQVPVLHVPAFNLTFVGGNNLVVQVLPVWYGMQDLFLVLEDDRPYPGQSRAYLVDLGFNLIGVQVVMYFCEGSVTDNTHIPKKDVDELGKFIDLCGTEEFTHGEETRVIDSGNQAAREVRAVTEHGGEFEYEKWFTAKPNPFLGVENVMFSC